MPGALLERRSEWPGVDVTRCRLARAASDLADGENSVATIARRIGYDSESSFTKAFTRHFGVPPGAYRRRLRTPDTVALALQEVQNDTEPRQT